MAKRTSDTPGTVSLLHDPSVVAIVPKAKEVAAAAVIVIKTPAQYQQAGEHLKTVNAALEVIETARVRITGPLNTSIREVNNQARESSAPWLHAQQTLKRGLLAYSNEQLRIQREQQQRADEAARKTQEKLQLQAATAQAAGKMEKAEVLQSRAEAVVPAIITREIPKVAGLSTRENWFAECTDLDKLVAAVAAGTAPLSLLMANDKVLGQQARSLKKDFIVPGVRVWSEKSLAAGT